MSILIYNQKKKREKDNGKTVKSPKGAKTFDLSIKNDNVKKIDLRN